MDPAKCLRDILYMLWKRDADDVDAISDQLENLADWIRKGGTLHAVGTDGTGQWTVQPGGTWQP